MQHPETTASIRLVLSSGSLVLRSVRLHKPESMIGRRPYNDLQLDDLTVSGEHAAVHRDGSGHLLIDLGSRNGTWVNGRAITRHTLSHGDSIAIGIYGLRYLVDERPEPAQAHAFGEAKVPRMEFVSGPRAGEVLRLERAITSLSGVGERVAVVARRRDGYVLTHLEGPSFPSVNGRSIGLKPHPLLPDDLIELGDSVMRFRFGG